MKNIGRILRALHEQKGVEIIETQARPDHPHVAEYFSEILCTINHMGNLEEKSRLMIFDEHANIKCNYEDRHSCVRGYYVDTVEQNKMQIQKCVK